VSGRVLSFEGRSHGDVERMLPWYANGTLDADDAVLVRQHLADCAQCRGEIATLRALMDAHGEPGADDIAGVDRDWSRLRNRLRAQRQMATRPGFQRMRTGWRMSAPWMRVAMAAQFGVVAILAVFLLRAERAPPPAPDDAPYRTLSAPVVTVAAGDTLLVVFDPRLTDAQLRELLGANHARIVDGPNTAGAFVVAAPKGQAEPVRNALRASPGIVMAELLSPAAGEAR